MPSLANISNEELVSRYTVSVYVSTSNEKRLRAELLRRLAERESLAAELRAWRFAAGDTTSYDVALAGAGALE